MAPSKALTEPFVSTLATLPFAAFWCTALNRNSRIVGEVGRDGFVFFACSRSSQPFCLCHVNGRYSMSLLHADPSRSRCKPQSRSVQMQIGFHEFRQRFALPRSGRLLVFTLLCVAFSLVDGNFTFTFRVAQIGGLRGLRSEDSCPCWSTWASRILPVYAPGVALYECEGRRTFEVDDKEGVHGRPKTSSIDVLA
jgi:hypothetical protein